MPIEQYSSPTESRHEPSQVKSSDRDNGSRPVHGRARQPDRPLDPARHRAQPARLALGARVGRERVHPVVRGADAHGRALGERYGRRRVFTGGLVLFSAASGAAALAPSGGLLIAARLVQGAGGAVLMPLTLTLLTAAFPAERRAGALGMWSAIAGLGVALGPIAGGLLTDALSWHWIFWINVPIGLVAAALAPRVLAESGGRRERIDAGGLLLASASLLAIVWTTVRGNSVGWDAPVTLAGYAAGIAFPAGFVRWEGQRDHAMLPLRLFSSRTFSTTNVAAVALHVAMFGAFFGIVQFLAHVRGISPIMTGVWTLPWTLMPLFVSPLAGRLAAPLAPPPLTSPGLPFLHAATLRLP